MKSVLVVKIFLTAAAILTVGCVGTVKEANPIASKSADSTNNNILTYPGIESAKAISNDKVEIFFPVLEGDLEQAAYVIRYSGQVVPTYLTASNQKPINGRVKFTVTGLTIDTQYTFSVQTRNVVFGVESTNKISKDARTFSNVTANFSGISQVKNLPGSDGLNGIQVFWNEAEIKGTASKNPIDPVDYRITVIDGNLRNPGNMNDASILPPERIVTSSSATTNRSAIINGLKPNTKYFVQVRAIHYGKTFPAANLSNLNYKVEENTNYLEIKTYSDDISDLEFDSDSFKVSHPTGTNAFNGINTKWTAPQGNFDHYRIYYTLDSSNVNLDSYLNSPTDTICSEAESANAAVVCEYSDFTKTSRTIANLQPNRLYNVVFVICLKQDCQSEKLIGEVVPHTTTPPMTSFSGIRSITSATSIFELDKMFLNYEKPNFALGNFDGLLVEYYGNDPLNTNSIQLNHLGGKSVIDSVTKDDLPNSSGLTIDEFDYTIDTKIGVSGINPLSSLQYCFMVSPFVYDVLGNKVLFKSGLNPVCQVPVLNTHTAASFPGITNVICNNDSPTNKSADIYWDTPVGAGIYDSFEVYIAKGLPLGVSIDFFSATLQIPGSPYTKLILNSSRRSVKIINLVPGENYQFAVVTRFQNANGVFRSPENNILGCGF